MKTDRGTDVAQYAADFHRDGFVLLPALSNPTELAHLKKTFDALVAARTDAGSFRDLAGPRNADTAAKLPQFLKPERDLPELLDSDCVRGARTWAGVLLDTPADELDYYGHIILKPAHGGVPTPWHQDEAYWDPRWQFRAVTIWIPLDDADVDNGCMHFVPGSHTGEVWPHRHIGGNDDIEGLEAVDPPIDGSTACPVPAGQASAHAPRTLHYAGANRTRQPRWAYIHIFSTTVVTVDNPVPRPWLTRS